MEEVEPEKREAPLIVISSQPEDLELARLLARQKRAELFALTTRDEGRRIFAENPEATVLWDADRSNGYDAIGEILPKYCKPRNIFAITSKPLKNYPDLFRYQIFNHHLQRKYQAPAAQFLASLVSANYSSSEGPPMLQDFFPPSTAVKKITLSHSSHKGPATEAIQNYLNQQSISGRLAGSVAQSIDELLINAIYDAPINDEGERFRHSWSRTEPFPMEGKERVELELAATPHFIGACVTDFFGSLKKESIIESLGKHYRRAALSKSTSPMETGLGVRGILNTGLSFVASCDPGKESRMMIFFKKSPSFADFKASFQFTSLFVE